MKVQKKNKYILKLATVMICFSSPMSCQYHALFEATSWQQGMEGGCQISWYSLASASTCVILVTTSSSIANVWSAFAWCDPQGLRRKYFLKISDSYKNWDELIPHYIVQNKTKFSKLVDASALYWWCSMSQSTQCIGCAVLLARFSMYCYRHVWRGLWYILGAQKYYAALLQTRF